MADRAFLAGYRRIVACFLSFAKESHSGNGMVPSGVIFWGNVGPDLGHHMPLLGYNVLMKFHNDY